MNFESNNHKKSSFLLCNINEFEELCKSCTLLVNKIVFTIVAIVPLGGKLCV